MRETCAIKSAVYMHVDGVQGHDSARLGYTRPGTAWTNVINSVTSHAPGAG